MEDPKSSDDACRKKCVDIFELHLERNSERQVNVSYDQRAQVRAQLEQLQEDQRYRRGGRCCVWSIDREVQEGWSIFSIWSIDRLLVD